MTANEEAVRVITSADFDLWLNHTAGLDGVKDTCLVRPGVNIISSGPLWLDPLLLTTH